MPAANRMAEAIFQVEFGFEIAVTKLAAVLAVVPLGSAISGVVPLAGPILPGRYSRDRSGELIEIEPPRLCPELLTEEEAASYLRLDVANVGDTLRYYRENHGLRAVQISRRVLYPREQLEALWKRLEIINYATYD